MLIPNRSLVVFNLKQHIPISRFEAMKKQYQEAVDSVSRRSTVLILPPEVELKEITMRETVKVIYRKNLNMSKGKLAAQVAHAVIGLGIRDPLGKIIVLEASDTKFNKLTKQHNCYIHKDNGITEVPTGTDTCAAWIEK